MKIIVEIKSVFGTDKIFPRCEKSKIFAEMLKQKTLTREDCKKIKLLGYEIEVVSTTTI